MITQREVAILVDAIKKQSGLTALYALADYNYKMIPEKPERHRYAIGGHEGVASPEPKPKPSATAHVTNRRRGRRVKVAKNVRALTQTAVMISFQKHAAGSN